MRDTGYQADWRPRSMRVRRFFAKYMRWVLIGGYAFVILSLAGLVASFVIAVDQTVSTKGGDPASVQFAVIEVKSGEGVLIRRRLVQSGEEVRAGQPIAEISSTNGEATLEAERAGTLYWTKDGLESAAPKDKVLAWIADRSRLQAKATVRGESIAQAAEGQVVRLSLWDPVKDNKAVMRINANVDGRAVDMVSESVLGDAERAALAEELKGLPFRMRRDRTLKVTGVEMLEVEIDGHGSKAASPGQVLADPPRDLVVSGRVTRGKHKGKVQLANLPDKTRRAVQEMVNRAVEGKSLELPGNGAIQLERDEQMSVVIQASLEGDGAGFQAGQEGPLVVPLERTFEVEIDIPMSPWLAEAIHRANLRGEPLRAQADVVTGQRSLAFQLLRR